MTNNDELRPSSDDDAPAPASYAATARALAASNARVTVVDIDDERCALVRPHELLVRRSALDRLRSAVAPVGVQIVKDLGHDLLQVLVTDDIDLKGLVDSLRGTGDQRDVALNHVFTVCAATPGSTGTPGDGAGTTPPADPPTDPTAPQRGEWWGGTPGSGGPGSGGARGFVDASAADVIEPASVASAAPTPDESTTTADEPAIAAATGGTQPGTSDLGPLHGEWWGGPIGSPAPVPPFGPPEDASGGPAAAVVAGETDRRPPLVALLDTGVVSHPWWAASDWFAHVAPDDIEHLGDNTNPPAPLPAEAGHGTFVAGVVLQHAATAYIDIQRVLASDGLCDEAELISVLYELAALPAATAPDAINMSFGGYTVGDETPQYVADALAALPPTTALVAAAGNYASDRLFWPAALPDVTAVGALNADGTALAKFSNYGPWVDTYRIGVRVQSSYVSYPATELPNGTHTPAFAGYARWNGTSFAAPTVTGEAVATSSRRDVDARTALADVVAHSETPAAPTP